jgi:hypothetical protein
VFVALGARREMRMRRIDICGLYSSTAFFHLSHKLRVIGRKVWVVILCGTFCVKHFVWNILCETFCVEHFV